MLACADSDESADRVDLVRGRPIQAYVGIMVEPADGRLVEQSACFVRRSAWPKITGAFGPSSCPWKMHRVAQ